MSVLYPTPAGLTLITLDAETFYSDEYSLRKMATSTYIRDQRFKVHLWAVKVADAPAFWLDDNQFKLMAKGIDWSKVAIVGHNLRFDGLILAFKYGIKPALWIDTLGMARSIIGGRLARHGLDEVAKYFGLGGKLKGKALTDAKGKRDLTPAELATLGAYAVDDVNDTHAAYTIMAKEFPDREYWFLDWATRMASEPKLRLDETLLQTAHAEEVEHKAALLASLPYSKTQLASNPQFADILRAHGVTPPVKISKTTGKEAYDFSKNSIKFRDLAGEDSTPEVQQLVEARMAVKSTIVETRALRYMGLAAEGPWCVPLNYAGAMQTSRLSGGDKQNPQNLSNGSKIRDAVEAPDGYLIVAVDSSGIELRVAATLAGELDVVARALAGEDEYARFASSVYGYKVHKKTHPDERKVGKVGVLSLGYQSGAATFRGMLFAQTGIILPLEECERIVKKYREEYAKYPALWRAMGQRMSMLAEGRVPPNLPSNPPIVWDSLGYRSIYSGTRVSYPNIHNAMMSFVEGEPPSKMIVYDNKRKKNGLATIYGGKATENLSQFLAREVVNYQTHKIWRATGLRPQLQVHDELVYVVPERAADAFFRGAVALMSGPVPWWPALVTSAAGGYDKSYGNIDK